jgi:hypothetical protein
MTRSASGSPVPSEFDDFLLAPIGEDRNGTLSVLSALARMDIDPWEEAARLAQLPAETATRKLASLLAAPPGGAAARPDSEAIAPRLIALLPCPTALDVRPHKALANGGGAAHSAFVTYVICYLIFMAVFVLIGRLFMESVQPPAQAAKAPTISSSTPLPQPPRASSGE